jgi:uncharacterized protein YcfL
MKTKTALLMFLTLILMACDSPAQRQPTSSSGVQQTTVQVQTGPDGLTVEQRNVRDRLSMDNKPGSIKHLYIISAYSGQVLIYSTVRGKVTSSGKRLTPTTVAVNSGEYHYSYGIPVNIGGSDHSTSEVLQDDGTYGSSVDYIYWWDSKGVYHQQYITGGMIVHISDQPVAVKSITINMEQAKE